MPYDSLILDLLFLVSVVSIWLMIIYQLLLTFAGYRYRRNIQIEHVRLIDKQPFLPPVSIMIPARDEELVIQETIDRLLKLDYPTENFEIIVINDGSTDRTAEIVNRNQKSDSMIRLINLPAGKTGHGKAYVLNTGLNYCTHDLVAIYDADNRPEPSSLKYLIPHLLDSKQTGAVIGKFRTINRKKNWLTRWINIETLAFQWILQAGRYYLSNLCILPGTNYVIRKSVLQECGGWDEGAITEDSELSVRIYQKGYKIKFVPLAVTWEQEPEKLTAWTRQRTRWVRGNNYVLHKIWRQIFGLKNKILTVEFIYLFALYYVFLFAIFISHSFFIFSSLGIIALGIPGPYTAVWISAFILFVMEIVVVLSYEDEDSLINIILTILMYLTYCQLWLYVVLRGLIMDIRKLKVGVWDKTERVIISDCRENEPQSS
jgi:cellulose synthase/poly-beta-1,6-N-acetylglucosamine synthase-like glycosyltransferase